MFEHMNILHEKRFSGNIYLGIGKINLHKQFCCKCTKLEACNKGEVSGIVLLDLSAAFDLVTGVLRMILASIFALVFSNGAYIYYSILIFAITLVEYEPVRQSDCVKIQAKNIPMGPL